MGILSGRGRDLMRVRGLEADCEYFIPQLRYWFTESVQYPFIGGDVIDAGQSVAGLAPSVNLILPYTWPRYLRNAPDGAVRRFSQTCLSNARSILRALESCHQLRYNTALTLRRLGEALYRPFLPEKGATVHYDLNAPASACVAEDELVFARTAPQEEL
ncbi:MAG: hypothetical protein Q4B99_04480 [Clostridia bacterium]|nr:hypothetical protein [Clostridia bacterium]